MLRQSAFGARKPISNIRLIYANDYNASGGEVYPTNDITIKSALENPAGTITVPVTFDGQTSKVIKPGKLAFSDKILPADFGLAEFPANWNPYPRTECDIPSGGKWPWNNISGPARPAGTAIVHCSSSDVSQVNNTGAFTVPAGGTAITYAGFGVVGIIGEYVDEPDIAIYLDDTSIGEGLSDTIYNGTTGGGHIKRGIAAVGQIPWVNCCRSGAQAVNWTTAGKRNTNRKILMGFCTHMYSGNGTNDLLAYTTAETYTALQAKYADFRARAKGAKYILQAPIIPRTDNTNTPLTDYGVGEERDIFNAYVLAQTGKTNCHDDFVDLNSIMDNGSAGWANTGWQTDWIHPNATGYAAMAPAVSDRVKYLTPYNTARMSSVVANFDVSKPWTIDETGGAISQFRDVISQGVNYLSAGGAAQPTYNATGLDGTRPAVTFDGNDVMNVLTTIAPAGGYDVFAVIRPAAATGTNRTILSSNAVGGFQMLINTTNKLQISKRQSSVLCAGTTTLLNTETYVLEAESQSSNTLIRGVVDGTQDGISTNPPTFTEGIVYFGGRGGAEYLNTDAVAEIVVCDKSLLSAADRANLYKYFAAKWAA